MRDLLGELEKAGNALNMVVLDSDRTNPFAAKVGLVTPSVSDGTIIVYATGAGKNAQDGKGRNGLFTEQLLKNLGAKRVEVTEIFNRTKKDVTAASGGEQVPEIVVTFSGSAYLN